MTRGGGTCRSQREDETSKGLVSVSWHLDKPHSADHAGYERLFGRLAIFISACRLGFDSPTAIML